MSNENEPRPMSMIERWATDELGSLAPDFGPRKSATMTEEVRDRVHGTVIGSAVGDALGAPFEFGGPGQFSARYPNTQSQNEMQGGGPWEPGEFTDDTQMAILEAEAFVAANGIDESVLFDLFQQWVKSAPKDIGVSTRVVLTDPAGWPNSPRNYYLSHPDSSAGNGSIMRSSFMAAYWGLASNLAGTAEVARRLSVVTHGDPAASEGRALLHMIIKVDILDKKFAVPRPVGLDHELSHLKGDQRNRFADVVNPATTDTVSNGTAWGVLRDAAQALHAGHDFASTMRIACDVAGDVDTVAAVAGAWAGAKYGLNDIPERWIAAVNGDVLGQRYDASRLIELMDKVLLVQTDLPYRPIGWQPNVSTVRYGFSEYFDSTDRVR